MRRKIAFDATCSDESDFSKREGCKKHKEDGGGCVEKKQRKFDCDATQHHRIFFCLDFQSPIWKSDGILP